MSVPSVRLESVRRNTGGRVHLVPRVPPSGPVTTLCGRNLAANSFAAVASQADCANCVRRSRDPSRISGAFFAQEEGSELLRLSLEQARLRKPVPSSPPAEPAARPAPKPALEVKSDRIGELVTRGFKPAGEGVWRSPARVVVRMRRKGDDWRFDELIFEGRVVATRVHDGIRVRAGDVEVSPSDGGVEVRLGKG